MDVDRAAHHVLHRVGIGVDLFGIGVQEFVALFVLELLTVLLDDQKVSPGVQVGLDCVSHCHGYFT